MSLYGEYKAGLIDDYLYSALARREEMEQRDNEFDDDFDESEEFIDDEIDEF